MIKSFLLNKSGLWAVLPEALGALIPSVFDGAEVSENQIKAYDEQSRDSIKIDAAGILVIEISGMIVSGVMPWEERVYKLCNPHRIRKEIKAAMSNAAVKGVMLIIDSPGGYSKGVNTLLHTISQATKIKPIVTFCDGVMCSAAYWIGSAALKVVAEPTAESGSIGAYLTHYDYSVMLQNAGITAKIVRAGKEKAVGNPVEPLTEEAEAVLQKRIDSCNELFISAVSENLGVTKAKVKKDMAEGRVFGAQEAKKVGLIDEVGQVESAFELLHNLISEKTKVTDMKIEDITIEALTQGNPGLLAQIQAKTQAPVPAGTFALAAKITAIAGAEAGVKIEALEAKGITPEQVVEVFDAFGIETLENAKIKTEAKTEDGKEEGGDPLSQAQNLLMTVAANLTGSPIGAQDGNEKVEVTGDNYMISAEAMSKDKGISVSEAQTLIDKDFPEARSAYMENANKKK